MIQKNGRTQFNLHAEGNTMLTEAERNIFSTSRRSRATRKSSPARSLVGTKARLRGSAIFNRQVLGDVSATLNTEVEHNRGSRADRPRRPTRSIRSRANTRPTLPMPGVTLNGDKAQWRWNVTGNADLDRTLTDTDRNSVDFPSRPRSRDEHFGRHYGDGERDPLQGPGGRMRGPRFALERARSISIRSTAPTDSL